MNTKIDADMLKRIASHIDELHSRGYTVTARKINVFLYENLHFQVHRTTIGRVTSSIGLSWAPIKSKPRTFAAHRHEHLRDYLIKLDEYEKKKQNGDESFIMVYMDESYIYQNHQQKNSYLSIDQKKNGMEKKLKKGRWLIIVHTITAAGPVAEKKGKICQ